MGMYMVSHYNNKVCGQSRSIVLRFPGSGILVPCRHGWIFMVAQVWHGMSQAFVLGHSFEQWVGQEQLGPGSSGLLVLQVQWVWAAYTVQMGVVQVVQLGSGVWLEPAVWQLCHLGQCCCFDTAFMKMSLHVVVCGTIAGAYLIAVPW